MIITLSMCKCVCEKEIETEQIRYEQCKLMPC